jgi:hypothetical protein
MATQSSVIDPMALPPLTLSESEIGDLPSFILDDPEPDSLRGQQVSRLEQLGLDKAAQAVSACGRLGEKSTYECGRSFIRKIIRSHRRFCCPYCDKHVAANLFEEHRAYRERLHPSGKLYLVTVESDDSTLSPDNIRNLEDKVVKSVRRLKGSERWGFKTYTNYESGRLIAKGILYVPPGETPKLAGLGVPSATCTVSAAASVHAFETMLADILQPTVTVGLGIFRAELMAAFQGGNHLRSMGVFYGLISKNREKKRPAQSEEKLHLSITPEGVSGAALVQPKSSLPRYAPHCPHCGPGCDEVAVSVEPLSELKGIPTTEEYSSAERIWIEMRRLLREKRVF